MNDYMNFVTKAWNEFVKHNKVNKEIKKDIRDSWIRCKEYNVDYMDGRGIEEYKVPVEIKLRENVELVSVAHSIMENLYNTISGSGFALFLSDKDGYILDVIGDESILEKAEELRFIKGALWSEKVVGTNAIGTCLYLDKPIQTIGAEHYGIEQHSWTCSSAPIHDSDGKILGCINMSGICKDAHLHTLGIVIAAAESIKKQLELILSYNLLNITFDSIVEGMIVIDENFNIKKVNHRAENILGIDRNEIFKIDIKKALGNLNFNYIIENYDESYNNIECDFHIKNRRIKCILNVVPMSVNNKFMGVVITFRESKFVHKFVNKVVGYNATYTFKDIVTSNEKMINMINFAKKASKSDCNILIEGSSGTGKELIAQAIHNYSERNNGPFVAVNCASIPRELMESELFGYDKGAFTGAAKEGHPGKFELADGGTIFLDELGELPLDMQSKLLRVLDNNTIVRVGGNYEKKLDVRIIGATNKELREEINRKTFREDLYYRLNVMNIKTIPLKERKEDIEILSEYFVNNLNIKNMDKCKLIKKDYINQLKKHDWPGNIRELRNVIERDYYSSENDMIYMQYSENDSIVENNFNNEESKELDKILPIDILEKESIIKAINLCEGNIVKSAEMLGISRATIYRKIKKYNIKNM
ncbi:sensory box protein [Clostridium argentinense CDC 2741]|uniref:Sensory box protein n=1 Tax=Clostridium argentinense CDC 2741 TaxID=1418104 RepID=A0A0C1U083_9CLOT|nr:sigma-54-dependent Fis family transcriptional regulator [Clostridium argentinense]ARC86066.1 sigma-54-dependent Fis family transcriptional regulator [Clostridium argentinense]KIE46239.1 sensory box protein [Clostridium argentinense CDC 2741]NFF39006.1 sigma-54-dependent Fis family transcriptional regulator [Clostridium argentinense]NFP48798.1 sigma-54-dependent Fis family transcriptional regulator [Clostridium argentinense]NFP70934.1 sigma-54-dependent Fis family transcriptional regulator [